MAHPSQTLPKPNASAASESEIRVVLVISSKLERLGWSIVVEGQDDLRLIGQFGSCDEGIAFLEEHPADVALVDEAILTPKHCEALRRDAAERGTRFLLVARHPIEEAAERLRYAFASDCLLKGVSAADLLAAIRGIGQVEGGPPLRQIRVRI